MVKRDDAGVKRETFAERVRGLMEKNDLTQGELAELAEIAATGLSRILSDDRQRKPTMAHVLSIAAALKVTAMELVAKTEAEGVLAEWVTREEYDKAERDRLEAINDLEVARADVASRMTENGALRAQVVALSTKNAEFETELEKQRGELELGRKRGEQVQRQNAQIATLTAQNQGLERRADELQAKLAGCHANFTNATRELEDAQRRVADVQRQLVATHNGAIAGAAAAAIIGGIFGHNMATTSRRARRT